MRASRLRFFLLFLLSVGLLKSYIHLPRVVGSSSPFMLAARSRMHLPHDCRFLGWYAPRISPNKFPPPLLFTLCKKASFSEFSPPAFILLSGCKGWRALPSPNRHVLAAPGTFRPVIMQPSLLLHQTFFLPDMLS